jgi:hypothetical protein
MENTDNELIYLGQEGSEFVINKETGKVKIPERVAMRLLEVDRHTFLDYRDKLGIKGKIAQILTDSGVQGGRIFSAEEFYKLAKQLKPELAEAGLDWSIN